MKTTSKELEGDLQKHIIRWLKNHRNSVWYMKVVGSPVQAGGIPDIIICKNGKFIAMELKRPDGEGILASRQEAQLERINRAGGYGLVIDSYEQFVKTMNDL